MFFTYLRKELGRRRKQAAVVVIGFALAIGLVITIASMSDGVSAAQSTVLHSLYGVGTDITVTQPPKAQSQPGGGFTFGGPDQPFKGGAISRDQVFVPRFQGTLPSSDVSTVAQLHGVQNAVGGLTLTAIHLTGKLPTFPQGGTGGFAPPGSSSPGSSSSGGPTQINVASYSIEGVDTSTSSVGPLSSGTLLSGRLFSATDANSPVAVLDSDYAKQQKLSVGGKVPLDGTSYSVIGIVSGASGGENAYVPLAMAQKMASATSDVTTIYVKATSSSAIPSATAAIQSALPKATITTSSDLASSVTGSLSSASKLTGTFGKWLAFAVLVAAFAVASLITLSSVSRRVRELGTLKALGWRTRRVVAQVMGESLVLGVLGGICGVALGVVGAVLVAKMMPTLTATTGLASGPGGFGGAAPGGPSGGPPGPFGAIAKTLSHSVTVHMGVSLTVGIILAAIALAILGGLISGGFGGWRAAKLRPAEAMRRVE